MGDELHFKSAGELSDLLSSGSVSSVEIVQAFIDRVEVVDNSVKAFNSYDAEDALAQAKASDERRAKDETLGELDGIPVGLKDNLAVKDQPLTCSSKILESFISPRWNLYSKTKGERRFFGSAEYG